MSDLPPPPPRAKRKRRGEEECQLSRISVNDEVSANFVVDNREASERQFGGEEDKCVLKCPEEVLLRMCVDIVEEEEEDVVKVEEVQSAGMGDGVKVEAQAAGMEEERLAKDQSTTVEKESITNVENGQSVALEEQQLTNDQSTTAGEEPLIKGENGQSTEMGEEEQLANDQPTVVEKELSSIKMEDGQSTEMGEEKLANDQSTAVEAGLSSIKMENDQSVEMEEQQLANDQSTKVDDEQAIKVENDQSAEIGEEQLANDQSTTAGEELSSIKVENGQSTEIEEQPIQAEKHPSTEVKGDPSTVDHEDHSKMEVDCEELPVQPAADDDPSPSSSQEPSLEDEEEEEDDDRAVNEMEFQEMFYNRATQQTAFDLLIKGKLESIKNGYSPKVNKRARAMSGEAMKLRSSDPKPVQHESEKAVVDGAAGGGVKSEPSSSVAVQEGSGVGGIARGVNKSVAMVHELMERYERNKRRVLLAEKGKVAEEEGDEDSFDDDELLWEDDLDSSNSKSDFLKYTVPQWELKDKLYRKHYATIQNLTPAQVEKVCKDVMPELSKIMNEEVRCKRHEIFKSCGISKQCLRDMTVAEPFSSAQDYRVMNAINDDLLSDRDPEEFNGELLHYVSCVLVPESLIRIFATVNGISIDLAEKELRFGAGYDGILDDDVIKTLIDNKQEPIKN